MRKEEISALYKKEFEGKFALPELLRPHPWSKILGKVSILDFRSKSCELVPSNSKIPIWFEDEGLPLSPWKSPTFILLIDISPNWQTEKMNFIARQIFFSLLCRNIRNIVILTLWCICFFFYSVKLLFKSFFP